MLVKLRLKIHSIGAERQTFQTSTVWEVEPAAMRRIETGATFTVKYDTEDEARIYRLDGWAKFDQLKNRIRSEKL